MIFPISDDDSKLKHVEWVTILFIVINVAVFLYQQYGSADFTYGFSAVPKEITTNTDLVQDEIVTVNGKQVNIPQRPGPNPIFLTIFSAMFMHGSWMHLGSNMLFLWIFGDNVENRFGAFRFILFYVASGIVASIVHILLAPDSIIPSLGASGAIAGVLGAYLVMFPRNKVNALFFIKIISIPAFVVIGLWGLMQFLNLYLQQSMAVKGAGMTGGVAYAAHAGGLVAGIILGIAFRMMYDEEPDSVIKRSYQHDPSAKRWF